LSTLYLIRHGQASFGAADYDVLSELGAQQSRRLGEHWARAGHEVDAIYVGPRVRQRDTATHLGDAARDAGAELPAPIELAELDEYPAFELLKHWMPILQQKDPRLGEILAAPAGSRRLERAFEHIIGMWSRGELDTGHLESFEQFSTRVERGLQTIMEREGRGKRVAVITSGGPISIAMRKALGLADEMMLRVAWVIANASVSEFRYRDATALSLVSFNNTPHLDEPALVTYR
jgi:broad specificity phosphatase PhoE